MLPGQRRRAQREPKSQQGQRQQPHAFHGRAATSTRIVSAPLAETCTV
jgi:hypothetical protein